MKLFLPFLFILISAPAFSQIAVTGQVVDPRQQPIPGASVSVRAKSYQQGTTADQDGIFRLEFTDAGNYAMEIRSLGFETAYTTLNFSEPRVYDLGMIVLSDHTEELQTVEVTGRLQRDYTSEYSFSATKIAIRNKDLPQSIATVTKELMADRQAFQLSDAVKIASGVTANSYYNQFSIRGISQNEEGAIVNGMRTRQYYFNQPLTANIERVEVIKGPASATFSSVDPGGSINLVTKKPLSVARKEVSFSVGSFSMLRGALDFTGPLNEDKTLRYRVNGAYQENKSLRDLQGQKALLISPSFSYVPNDRTAINAELIYNNTDSKLDRGQPIFGAVAGQTSLNSTPTSFAIGATNDFFKSKEVMLTGSLAHKFSDAISFNTAYMKQTWTENLWEHRATNRFAVDVDNNSIPTLAAMQVVERQQYWNIDNVNSYFNFDFKVGQTRSKFLVGYDLHAWNKRKGGGQNAARGYLLTDGTVAAAYDPAKRAQYQVITVQGVEMPRPNVAHFDLANPLYTIKQNNDYVFATRTALPAALTTTNSIYVQELFTWSRISVLAGLRHEWFEDITNYEATNQTIVRKTKLLPRVGITYAVHKYVNVYATYLEGFQPQSNTVTLMPVAAPAGSTFDPLTSDLKELGVKAELLDSRVNLTASLYEINQRNILMNANDATNPDLLVTRGAERSRGFEVDLAGYIIPHWQINASYSYIDAQIREDQNPDLIGKRKQNTPVHSSNLWTRYDFVSGRAPGNLGVGLGVQYSGDMVPWFTRDFTIPSFIIFDAAVYYSPDKSDFQIALHANNLFNKTYWVGAQNYLRLFPGTPRSAMLTATYKF